MTSAIERLLADFDRDLSGDFCRLAEPAAEDDVDLPEDPASPSRLQEDALMAERNLQDELELQRMLQEDVDSEVEANEHLAAEAAENAWYAEHVLAAEAAEQAAEQAAEPAPVVPQQAAEPDFPEWFYPPHDDPRVSSSSAPITPPWRQPGSVPSKAAMPTMPEAAVQSHATVPSQAAVPCQAVPSQAPAVPSQATPSQTQAMPSQAVPSQALPSKEELKLAAARATALYRNAVNSITNAASSAGPEGRAAWEASEHILARSFGHARWHDRGPRGEGAPPVWRGQEWRKSGRYANRGGNPEKNKWFAEQAKKWQPGQNGGRTWAEEQARKRKAAEQRAEAKRQASEQEQRIFEFISVRY